MLSIRLAAVGSPCIVAAFCFVVGCTRMETQQPATPAESSAPPKQSGASVGGTASTNAPVDFAAGENGTGEDGTAEANGTSVEAISLPGAKTVEGTASGEAHRPVVEAPASAESTPAEVAVGHHASWTRILKQHVSEEGWIDYRALRQSSTGDLEDYLQQLATTELAELSTKNEQMAFWINAYNALCVRTLIDHDLPKEVPHAFVFGANIFKEKRYRVAGKIRPLDEIEHEILRPKFADPRVHAALVCGASSCPRLRPEAYEGDRLDQQLDEETRRWIGFGKDKKGRRKNELDRAAKVFRASKIFDWFAEDFGDGEAGVLAFIRRYASPQDAAFLAQTSVRLKYLDYDWSLNSRP